MSSREGDSWDFFDLNDRCDIRYCSLLVLIVSVAGGLLVLIFIFCCIKRKILFNRFHKIQIKKAPQKNSSEISIFPKKNEAKAGSLNKGEKKKAKKTAIAKCEEEGTQKAKEISDLYRKPKQAKKEEVAQKKNKNTICASERPSNKINNFLEEAKGPQSENLRIEYFEDRDANTDITTIPKDRRGLANNASGLSFLNFSNNGDLSEKNYENFMKLKNKKRMFNNDDSIEFEDVENIDMNQSDKGSFRIENKLEIKNEEDYEPKIPRNTEVGDIEQGNMNVANVLRNLENEPVFNAYIDQSFPVHELADLDNEVDKKGEGLEVVREVNEESERENKK